MTTMLLSGQVDHMLITYAAYVLISIGLTIWVGRTLHRNGRLFLVDVFNGNEALADSVNHLLLVGFYLINFGFVSLALKLREHVTSATQSVEALSYKVGYVLVVLGAMHFMNLYIFSRIRRSKPTTIPRNGGHKIYGSPEPMKEV